MGLIVTRQKIQRGEADESKRTVDIILTKVNSPYDAYTTALSGKKLPLSKNGAAQAASTNDVAIVDGTNIKGLFQLVLELDEIDTLGRLYVAGVISGTSVQGFTIVEIVEYDPTSAGALTDEAVSQRSGLRL